MSKRKLSDTDEHESDSDPQDEIDPSQRPRKKVYKSTLRKRNREKRRRDQFNEGLQQLADIVFSIDPSVASGRDSITITNNSGPSTSVTNRGELMQTAVDGMKRLVREHNQQQKEIACLRQALVAEQTKYRLLAANTNHGLARSSVIEQQYLPTNSSSGPKMPSVEDLSALANSPAGLLGLAGFNANPLYPLISKSNGMQSSHQQHQQKQAQRLMHSTDSVFVGGFPNHLLSSNPNGIPVNEEMLTQSLLARQKQKRKEH